MKLNTPRIGDRLGRRPPLKDGVKHVLAWTRQAIASGPSCVGAASNPRLRTDLAPKIVVILLLLETLENPKDRMIPNVIHRRPYATEMYEMRRKLELCRHRYFTVLDRRVLGYVAPYSLLCTTGHRQSWWSAMCSRYSCRRCVVLITCRRLATLTVGIVLSCTYRPP